MTNQSLNKLLAFFIICISIVSFSSCGADEDDEIFIPKPKGYPRIYFPEKTYRLYDSQEVSRVRKYDYRELVDIINKRGGGIVEWIQIEPKYDVEVNKDQLKDLYHLTPSKNDDKIKDICFKGMKQLYKNGNFIKAQPVEYVFIYQPGEDWFLLKSLNK